MATRANTPRNNWGRVVNNEGMGGFLNPPTHPEHTRSVQSTYGDTFSMSLSSAAESTWLNDETRIQARGILLRWKKPPIESPEIQEWIKHVMGYFKGCYQSPSGSWNASDLLIDAKLDPIINQDKHAGVHLIRNYYPEFVLTENIIKEAYWGKKV